MKKLKSKFNKVINFSSISENSLKNRLFKGMAWNITGTILSKAFLMVASIITARILGVDKNGEYGVINSTVLMFSTFAGLGLGTTATRFVAEYKVSDKEKCGKIIGMTNFIAFFSGFIMAILLFFLSGYLSKVYLHAPQLKINLQLAAILLWINTVNTVQLNTLAGFESFKKIAQLSIIQGIITVPVFVVLTYFFSVNGLILGNIIVSIILVTINGLYNYIVREKNNIKVYWLNFKSELSILWKFSLPSLLGGIMVGPIMWIGNALLTALPSGYAELGIFNAANQWRNILTFIPTAIGNVILPFIVANDKNKKLQRINILLSWIIVCAIAIPLCLFPELVGFVYGVQYQGSSFNLTFICIVLMCCILSYKEGIARNLVSANLMWWGFFSNFLWGISFILFVYLFRFLGSVGLALGYLFSYIVTTIIFVPFYISKEVVSKELIISKDVIGMWFFLAMQFMVVFVTDIFWVRIPPFILSCIWLIKIIRIMSFNKE